MGFHGERGRERERKGGRSEATLLVHVYHGSPPRNMIYRGAVGRRAESRGGGGGGRGYSGFQKYRRLREKVTSGGGLAGRGTRGLERNTTSATC